MALDTRPQQISKHSLMITNKLKLVLRAYFSANSTPEPDDEAALHLLVLQALKTESLARHNLMNVTER